MDHRQAKLLHRLMSELEEETAITEDSRSHLIEILQELEEENNSSFVLRNQRRERILSNAKNGQLIREETIRQAIEKQECDSELVSQKTREATKEKLAKLSNAHQKKLLSVFEARRQRDKLALKKNEQYQARYAEKLEMLSQQRKEEAETFRLRQIERGLKRDLILQLSIQNELERNRRLQEANASKVEHIEDSSEKRELARIMRQKHANEKRNTALKRSTEKITAFREKSANLSELCSKRVSQLQEKRDEDLKTLIVKNCRKEETISNRQKENEFFNDQKLKAKQKLEQERELRSIQQKQKEDEERQRHSNELAILRQKKKELAELKFEEKLCKQSNLESMKRQERTERFFRFLAGSYEFELDEVFSGSQQQRHSTALIDETDAHFFVEANNTDSKPKSQ